MINLRKITPLNNEFMEKIGFAWHTDNDNSSYIADEIVQVKASEADAYYEAKYPKRAGYEHKLMLKTAKRLKRNFNFCGATCGLAAKFCGGFGGFDAQILR